MRIQHGSRTQNGKVSKTVRGTFVFLLLAAATSLPSPLDGQEPSELPAALVGGADGITPQGASDLARTRELVYGRPLTAAQVGRIESWEVRQPEWWTSQAREASALDLLDTITDEYRQALTDEEFLGAVTGHESLFGLEVNEIDGAVVGGIGGPGSGGAAPAMSGVTIDSRLRPDLLLFHELFYPVAEQMADKEVVEIGNLLFELGTSGPGSAFAARQLGRGLINFVSAYQELTVGVALANLVRIQDTYDVEGGATYDLDAAEEETKRWRREKAEALGGLTRAYLAGLPHDIQRGLIELVVGFNGGLYRVTYVFEAPEVHAARVAELQLNLLSNQ